MVNILTETWRQATIQDLVMHELQEATDRKQSRLEGQVRCSYILQRSHRGSMPPCSVVLGDKWRERLLAHATSYLDLQSCYPAQSRLK